MVGFATLINVCIGVVFYLYQSRAIDLFFDENLERCTDGMMSSVKAGTPGIDSAQLDALGVRRSEYAMFSGFVLCVFDARGNAVVTTRDRPSRHPADPETIARVAADLGIVIKRAPADLVKKFDPTVKWARVIYRGFRGTDGKEYVLVAATADSFADHMLGLLKLVLLVALPAGVVVSGVSGWFVAGLAVRPLEEVRQTAAGLSPESIDRRLSVRTSSPETSLLEDELNQARERIARAFAAQERFMSNVSHELKTPIAVVMAEAQTLDLRHADAETVAFVRSAREEMRRLGTMIDSFLLLTRVREGRALHQSRPCPVNDLVMESVGHCLAIATRYGVRLDPRLCENTDACVRGDPSLLRTMLDNLVRNAVRFSPQGSAIHVCADVEDGGAGGGGDGGGGGGGGAVVFRVRDHGPGIPEAIIGRIFDRFVQGPEELRRGRGHGLGLEIAQGIAELHGGEITVRNCAAASGEDHHGKVDGCEFTVRLPRSDATTDHGSDGQREEALDHHSDQSAQRMS